MCVNSICQGPITNPLQKRDWHGGSVHRTPPSKLWKKQTGQLTTGNTAHWISWMWHSHNQQRYEHRWVMLGNDLKPQCMFKELGVERPTTSRMSLISSPEDKKDNGASSYAKTCVYWNIVCMNRVSLPLIWLVVDPVDETIAVDIIDHVVVLSYGM